MKKRGWFALIGSGAIGALVVSGIGCSGDDSSGGAATSDAGAGSDATTSHDGNVGVDAAGDTNAPGDAQGDAPVAPPPVGKLVAPWIGGFIVGVTSDAHVVYVDNGALFAADLTGADAGAAVRIESLGSPGWYATIAGNVVFAWSSVTSPPKQPVGALTVWSQATGVNSIAAHTYAGFAAASGDGSKIVYALTDANGLVGNIVASNTDGSTIATLVSGAQLGGAPGCLPQVAFAGAGRTDALVAYCFPTDAATNSATLDAFSGASWTKKNLTANLAPSSANVVTPLQGLGLPNSNVFVLDKSSTNILAITAASQAIAISYPSGNLSNLETGAALPAFFTGSGASLTAVYAMTSGAIHASSVPATTPVTLVTSGVKQTFTMPSPDEKWGIYASVTGTVAGQSTSDMTLFATSTPAATKTVVATADAMLGPPSFTSDSSRALVYHNITSLAQNSVYGDLTSYDVAAGTSTLVADKVWAYWLTGSGSKVVYNDRSSVITTAGGNSVQVADIKIVDLSVSPLAPKTLQLGADVNFWMTADLKTVVYAYTQGTAAQNGIYTIPAQ